MRVADARAALAALDSTARQLPNPQLLRRPSLQREAQSTSALKGTYEPLHAVLTADDEGPVSLTMREVLNFVRMADLAFGWVDEGRTLSVPMLAELQQTLVRGTPAESPSSGQIRTIQVVIGQHRTAAVGELPVKAARFVPPPPGLDLEANVCDLVRWMAADHKDTMDPVVVSALSHYQFETLHPIHDGNGRIGRLLIVLQLYASGVLSEPTLTVSPWFEARRTEYYDRLLAVSCAGEWDQWISFFAQGLEESAQTTRGQMLRLVDVHAKLKERVRASSLRADKAHTLVDYAVAHPSFTVRQVERDLELSYGRANGLVAQLVDLGVLSSTGETYRRRFFAPAVLDVLLST
ncbi:Fic family protein [Ornithinimicrobium sufpigmenti]|uniref:Fic family protein n=1 Tax=Ornithinimicrobium sufpigmenti TaxID=2508882 RepID=UPI00192DDD1B|nr:MULTISPECIES: Fic family protein [unclassified Ornithinimicrobium]